jgi:uncharacterized membrane protein
VTRDGRLRAATALLALVGVGISGYLLAVRATGGTYVCSTGGCEVVQSSRYAELGGLPVAAIGLVGYLLILAAAALPGDAGRAAGLSLALGGFAFSAYLLYVQLVLVDAVCLWCIASEAVMALLLAAAVARVCGEPATDSGRSRILPRLSRPIIGSKD